MGQIIIDIPNIGINYERLWECVLRAIPAFLWTFFIMSAVILFVSTIVTFIDKPYNQPFVECLSTMDIRRKVTIYVSAFLTLTILVCYCLCFLYSIGILVVY